MSFYKKHAPNHREHARNLPDLSQYEGMKDQRDESAIPSAYAEKEKKRIKELGLEPADSIEDKSEISCFQRGSSPHWSGINTFLKLPYVEDVRKVGEYDVAFVGVAVRHRLHIPHGDAVRAAGDATHLVALPEIQL